MTSFRGRSDFIGSTDESVFTHPPIIPFVDSHPKVLRDSRTSRGMTLGLEGRITSETSERGGREWVGKGTKKGELKLSFDYLTCV